MKREDLESQEDGDGNGGEEENKRRKERNGKENKWSGLKWNEEFWEKVDKRRTQRRIGFGVM